MDKRPKRGKLLFPEGARCRLVPWAQAPEPAAPGAVQAAMTGSTATGGVTPATITSFPINQVCASPRCSKRAMFIHSSKSISHISALHPDAAAIHIHRRLHAGVRRIQQLPRITADAPDNLGRARTATSPDSITANCVLHPHKQRRYVESRPGRMFHADIAGPFLKSTVGGLRIRYRLVGGRYSELSLDISTR